MNLIIILSIVGTVYIKVPEVQAKCAKEAAEVLAEFQKTNPSIEFKGMCVEGAILPNLREKPLPLGGGWIAPVG